MYHVTYLTYIHNKEIHFLCQMKYDKTKVKTQILYV